MKIMIMFGLILSATFAQASDVLLTCTKTNFSDLKTITVTTSELSPYEIVVTEADSNGTLNVFTRQLGEFENKNIELSDWNGYSRNLYNDGFGWNIEHRDECSSGIGSAVCF